MNFLSDIAALAKAGYTPDQVKEILVLAKQNPEATEEPTETETKEISQPDSEKEGPKAEAAQPKEPEAPKDSKQEEIDKLQKQIADLQKKNETMDVSGIDKKQEDPLINIVRSFM